MIKKLSSPLVSIICGAIWLAALDPGDAKGKEKDWITLDNCRLIPNKANDGDSFHVRANDTEYLVRLYFVDASETASVGAERLIEQAKYFGVGVPQVIEIGLDAKKFVDAKLSEPFTVVARIGWRIRTKQSPENLWICANKRGRSRRTIDRQRTREYPPEAATPPGGFNLTTNAKNSHNWRMKRSGGKSKDGP